MTQAVIAPQPGPQEEFLSSPADIVIYGGAAGGGKSYALLLEASRHIANPGYRAILFRRTTPQLTNSGGLWDTSTQLFPLMDGHPRNQKLRWDFPSGSMIKMSQLEYDNTAKEHDGAQYAFIGFDELIHFTEFQFFYLLSRNRSTCGVRPYIRATTNPTPREDPVGGWVRNLIEWWIDENGDPIQERCGVVRYFYRENSKVIWVDKDWRSPEGDEPRSLTFIFARLKDNKILMDNDPGYRSNLNALDHVQRERLKNGNWNANYNNGMFKMPWFKFVDRLPPTAQKFRYWDRAATEPTPRNPNPDWTAGALGCIHNGELYIGDMVHFRGSPAENEEMISATASMDGTGTIFGLEQEPGSSGKDTVFRYITNVLRGFTAYADLPSGDKIERAKPWCALAEQGHVYLVRGPWNQDFINEAVAFPFGKRDQVDAVSGLYKIANERDPGFLVGLESTVKEALTSALEG